jgi:putative ABC transport system permease protein
VIRYAVRALSARKLRTALTALAIVLGVAMVSGTFVLTDSIDQAFDRIFTDVREGSSVVITGKSAFDLSAESALTPPPFDESVLDRVRTLPGVAATEGSVTGEAQIIGEDGKALVYGGAPNLGFSIDTESADPDTSPFNPLTLESGDWPGPNEVAIDRATAEKEGFRPGQEIGVQAEGPTQRLRLAGTFKFGSVDTIGGATLAAFALPTAQRLFGKEGKLDEIAVAAKPGVSEQELVSQIEEVLPPTAQVRTGEEQAKEDAEGTDEFITFLRGFLLAFGGIALFVGAFVIANSLSITIAQRTREFATLRTLGASRRQVLGAVVLEALIVGVIASLIGLFLGLALAKLLFWLFDAVGFTLPNTGLVFQTRTIVVSLLLGVLVTLIASLRPAVRATRVPPIAAVREGATLPEGRLARFRIPGAILLAALGFAGILYGLFRDGLGTTEILLAMGLGALLVFLGVSLFASRLVPALATALGWPSAKVGGAAGELARSNAKRNPTRTASTAAALMIGLALVTLVAVLGAGIRETFNDAVDDLARGEFYAITAQNNFSPIPVSAAEQAEQTPGVRTVASVRAGEALIFGDADFFTAVDPDIGRVLTLDWVRGSPRVFSQLGRDGAFVDEDFAEDHNLRLGSPVEVLTPQGRRLRFRVKGIFDPPPGGSPFGPVTVSSAVFDANYDNPKNLYSFVIMNGGVSAQNEQRLERTLASFPNAKVADGEQFKENQAAGLSSILNILYVLLALSIVISLFGIVNTLVLTVFERTRELGMLRAIGMTRRQVRRLIRHESIVTALIGAALGIALGLIFGALLVARIDFIEFTLPTTQLILFAIAAIVVGLIAALFPARRAARLNVLEALQYE